MLAVPACSSVGLGAAAAGAGSGLSPGFGLAGGLTGSGPEASAGADPSQSNPIVAATSSRAGGREPLSRPPEVPQVSNRLRHEPPPGRLAEVVVADLTPIVNGEALRARAHVWAPLAAGRGLELPRTRLRGRPRRTSRTAPPIWSMSLSFVVSPANA